MYSVPPSLLSGEEFTALTFPPSKVEETGYFYGSRHVNPIASPCSALLRLITVSDCMFTYACDFMLMCRLVLTLVYALVCGLPKTKTVCLCLSVYLYLYVCTCTVTCNSESTFTTMLTICGASVTNE